MNLFDNIIQSSVGNFLGTKPTVPTPSFETPQAPRTVNYTAPQVPQVQAKPNMTLFSDEQQMFQKMKADNLPDDTAYSMLKKRRMDILGGNDLGNDEKEMLLKMQADNIPVKQAVSMIQQRRKDQFNKKYHEGNLLQKGAYNTLAFAAGNLETLAKYSGNTLDFITGGTMGFGDDVKAMEQVTQSPEFSQSSAFKAGTYAPDVALAVSPIGGGYLAGAKGMGQLALRSGVVGAGFGATNPIMNEGSDATIGDIATSAAVGGTVGAIASPVLSKVLKYGQAGYRGGLEGVGKSITRDLKSGVQAITPSGANISTKANRFNANEIREFTKTTGQSPGDFATSRGMTKVGDDAVVEATNLWKASKDQADEALQAIKGRFRFTDEGEDLLKTTIDDLETRLVNTKSPDAKRISQLKAKYEDSGLTMSEINEVKRAYSNNYKYSFVDAGSESALRSRNLQDAVRKWQFKVAEENGLTNLKEINKTTQGWKMFADSLSKKIQGSSGNNNVSLTDWIALSGGSPENIALYLGKKLASSDKVKSGAIKLFSKKTKPSIIQASKADIQRANFQKDVNRGVSGVGDNSGGKSLVKPVGLLTAPTGKATGAKNIRVNQKIEKSPVKNEGQVGNRPGTATKLKTNADVQLAKETARKAQVQNVEKELNTNLLSKYNPNKPEYTRKYIDSAIAQGKITKEEGVAIVEKLYEKATGFDKPQYEKLLNDLYSNKKIESFDDLLNEKQVQKEVKTPRQEFLETPEGIYEEINKKANDRRFNTEKANALIAKFKEKTGIDLMKNPMQKFDEKGNVIRTIVKPNTIKNESKVNKPSTGITIPDGYFKNAFGEIQKNPSNKKGGFIKIPEIGKKSEIKPEIEKYLKTQNIYDKKQGEYGTILKKLSEEYSDGKGGISDEGRLLPKYKEAKKNFDYYFKLLQDFNGLESSKKASKEFNKLGIVERQKIRRQINETKSKINVNDDSVGLGSDSNKSIPVKNPLVEEARKIPKMNKGQEDLFKKDYGDFIDLELELKRAIKQGIPKKEVIKKIKYIERAVSEDEYRSIIKNGYIQSNSNKNFSNQLGDTYYHTEGKGTSFYLPENGGYIVKIKVKPEHNIDINEVGEVFTNKKIPISDIVKIQGGNGIVKTK